MSRILVISGHPNLDGGSVANKRILENLEGSDVDVTVRRLDQLNKNFVVDVEAEQAALLEADLVVFQSPMHWYSVPALLKNWIDQVLTYGFAYGKTGDKLKGKGLMVSMTISSPYGCYQTLGYNNFTAPDLLNHIKQTALMSLMIYQEPVLTYEVLYIPGVIGAVEEIHAKADDHSDRLIAQLKAFEKDGLVHPVYSKYW